MNQNNNNTKNRRNFETTDVSSDEGEGRRTQTEVFAKRGLLRSPLLSKVVKELGKEIGREVAKEAGRSPAADGSTENLSSSQQEEQVPVAGRGAPRGIKKCGLLEAADMVDKMQEFVRSTNNVHTHIKTWVPKLMVLLQSAVKERTELVRKAEAAEKGLEEVKLAASQGPSKESKPRRTAKRDRDSPVVNDSSKKRRGTDYEDADGESSAGGWRMVRNRKENTKRKVVMKPEPPPKPKPQRVLSRGDALIVEAKEGTTYADLFRKLRAEPKLSALGESVTKTRRTQKGELLFELKKDPTVKSADFKELVESTLGEEATVRALSQVASIECKDLDEFTTAEELEKALSSIPGMSNESVATKLRKAYGGMQIATIRLSPTAANILLTAGSVRVGWSVGHFRTAPRIPKQMQRCFNCWDFGHQSRNCNGPDRSRCCRRCGEEGHFARVCKNQPKCMLCKQADDNAHETGGLDCQAYKKAKASQ